MKIVVLKNTKSCSHCKTFVKNGCMEALSKLWTVIDADKTDNKTVYTKWFAKYGKSVTYPTILIVDGKDKITASFCAYTEKTMTPDTVVNKVKSVCPDCCAGGCSDNVKYKTCPNCNGSGKVLASIALAFMTWLGAGCVSTNVNDNQNSSIVFTIQTTTTTNIDGITRRAVVWGLDHVNPSSYGGWSGDCTGTILDALRIKALLESRGYQVTLLTNEQATAYRVTSSCVAACAGMKDGDQFVAYGSSHGGQVKDVNGDENGGLDSTICLWDGQFTDDLVGEMLLRINNKITVNLILDCCNSGTMMRGPHDYVRVFNARQSVCGFDIKCNLIYMGGCGDGKSSYGGDDGGRFTNALVSQFSDNLTVGNWFKSVSLVMPRNQVPVFSVFGPDSATLANEESLK